MQLKNGKIGLALISVALLGAACKGDPVVDGTSASNNSSNNSSTTPPANGSTATVGQVGSFQVTVTLPKGVTYPYYLHAQAASFSAASCEIAPGSVTPNNDIYCYVDVQELDLLLNGIGLTFNAPPGMCPYTKAKLYHYWGLQGGVLSGIQDCTATLNTDTGVAGGSCTGSNLTYNGSSFVCDWDYTPYGGPNCCVGSYNLRTATTTGGTTTYSTYAKTNVGGSLANCLAGPSMDVQGYHDPVSGFPVAAYYSTSTYGVNSTVMFSAPIALNPQRTTNLYLANYWNPTDFKRTATVETGTFPPAVAGDNPKAMNTFGGYTPMPYYEFGCVDEADDYIARIRVLIRSWDTVSGFTATSNPYTDPTTNEPGFNNDYLYQDRSAWTDFSATHVNARFGDVFPGMTF